MRWARWFLVAAPALGLVLFTPLGVLESLLLSVLCVLLPLLATSQLRDLDVSLLQRTSIYAGSALSIGILAVLALATAVLRGGWAGVGLTAVPLPALLGWSAATTAAGLGLTELLRLGSGRAPTEETDVLRHLIPRTPEEKRAFVGLSFVAGFGEEIIYRGFAIPAIVLVTGSLAWAAVLSSLLFGLVHAYQGVFGIARTGLLGGLLAMAFLRSGSLWPVIVAHVAIDLVGGLWTGRRLIPAEGLSPSPPPEGQDLGR